MEGFAAYDLELDSTDGAAVVFRTSGSSYPSLRLDRHSWIDMGRPTVVKVLVPMGTHADEVERIKSAKV